MSNKIKNVKIDVLATIGENLVFKKFNNVVYKYVNNQKTDEVIGVNVEVFSTSTMDLYQIKLMDPAFVPLIERQQNLFGKKVVFSGLKMTPYINKNFINWSISAEEMAFNDK